MVASDLNKAFFSTSEVAKILHVSRIAVLKKIYSGILKAQKIGRNYVIAKDDVEALLGSRVTPEQEEEIKRTVRRAVKEYGSTFRQLGKE
ncbi:MAG: helix-turn-helix domain-containing protein [Minisyncoccia bacterium]